jgi:hypothetical protein
LRKTAPRSQFKTAEQGVLVCLGQNIEGSTAQLMLKGEKGGSIKQKFLAMVL